MEIQVLVLSLVGCLYALGVQWLNGRPGRWQGLELAEVVGGVALIGFGAVWLGGLVVAAPVVLSILAFGAPMFVGCVLRYQLAPALYPEMLERKERRATANDVIDLMCQLLRAEDELEQMEIRGKVARQQYQRVYEMAGRLIAPEDQRE